MSTKYETINPLPAATRDQIIDLLNGIMADILDNHYQSLLAHWNTKGANFISLHELFGRYSICQGAENWCDWVAERISQLGGTVVTTVRYIAETSSLKEYPLTITEGHEHVQALAASLVAIVERLRRAIGLARASDDHVTADILGEVQRSSEKFLWLLEAHIAKPRQS